MHLIPSSEYLLISHIDLGHNEILLLQGGRCLGDDGSQTLTRDEQIDDFTNVDTMERRTPPKGTGTN